MQFVYSNNESEHEAIFALYAKCLDAVRRAPPSSSKRISSGSF